MTWITVSMVTLTNACNKPFAVSARRMKYVHIEGEEVRIPYNFSSEEKLTVMTSS